MIPVTPENAADRAKAVKADLMAEAAIRQVWERLAEPFPANQVGWKPQSVKNGKALAIAYLDARDVMDRLDDVVGGHNWHDEYTTLPDGCVECRLSVRVGGEWVTKCDVGSPSAQPAAGDKRKAAYSDALKRAAVRFGIGRYLYHLGHSWAPYDDQRRAFVSDPPVKMAEWALPGGSGRPPKHEMRPVPADDDNPPAERAERPHTPPPANRPDNLQLRARIVSALAMCKSADDWPELRAKIQGDWGNLSAADQAAVQAAVAETKARLGVSK